MTANSEKWQAVLEALFEQTKHKVLSEMEEELVYVFREYSRNKLQEMLLAAGICYPMLRCKLDRAGQNIINKDQTHNEEEPTVKVKEIEVTADIEKKNEKKVEEEVCPVNYSEQELMNQGWFWYGLAIVPSDIDLGIVTGMENSNCQIVNYTDLCMIVCQVPQSEYGQDLLHNHLSDLIWVENRARKHEEILVSIMKSTYRMLPLPFCTLFSSNEHIENALNSNYDFLIEELNRIGILREINLKLLVDQEKLRAKFIKLNPFQDAQGGKVYFQKRQWEQNIKTQIEQFIEDKSSNLLEKLNNLAVDNLLLEGNVSELSGNIVVFNSCFLLHPERLQAWENEVSLFDKETDEWGFVLDISGPWPPFHFVQLQEDGLSDSSSNKS